MRLWPAFNTPRVGKMSKADAPTAILAWLDAAESGRSAHRACQVSVSELFGHDVSRLLLRYTHLRNIYCQQNARPYAVNRLAAEKVVPGKSCITSVIYKQMACSAH